jgi:hypothetical protein
MPKASKGKKRQTLRALSNLSSKRSRSCRKVSKAASLSDSNESEVEVQNVDDSGPSSRSSTPSAGTNPVAQGPDPNASAPILSSTLSKTVSKWYSKAANSSNDQSTRQILSQLATVVPLPGSMSQAGRVGVNFEDAHHEAISGLKPELAHKSKVKGKVCTLCIFEGFLFVLT